MEAESRAHEERAADTVAATVTEPPTGVDDESRGSIDPADLAQVEAVIEDVRPGILADGGDVELVSIDRDPGVVTVRLTGACVGCPSATITMKFGIERIMLDRVPWVTAVRQLEDHEVPEWAEY